MTKERGDGLRRFLEEKGARYQDDVLSHFESLSEIKQRHSPALSILDQRGLLQLHGPDTVKFLQGQLTCNVEQLPPSQHQAGTVCTPKGRMYSSFTLLNAASEHLLMAMHTGLLASTKASLDKYAVFFKTDIEIKQEAICLGLSGKDITPSVQELFGTVPEAQAATQVEDDIWLLPVNGLCDRFELWLPLAKLPLWWDRLTAHFTPSSDRLWRLLDIEAVTPTLTPDTTEKYIPQHLNLPSLKAVSFRKGCYTGQEIVARMQNLGQLKSRSYRLTTESTLSLAVDSKLVNGQGKNIGNVLDCVPAIDNNGSELLAVIRVESAEENDVFTEDGTQLSSHPLPYEVNPKEELQF